MANGRVLRYKRDTLNMSIQLLENILLFWVMWMGIAWSHTCDCILSTNCQCTNNSSQSHLASVICAFTNQSKKQILKENVRTRKNISLNTLEISQINELPSSLFNGIVSVNTLNISGNYLKEFPTAIFSLNKIKNLDISKNNLTKLVTSSSSGTLVKKLNVSRNKIACLHLKSFKAFGNLEELDLSWNEIHVLQGNTFAILKMLTYLDLSHNHLTHVSRNHFKDSGMKLRVINLSFNHLQVLDLNLFQKFINLRSINLSNNSNLSNFEFMNLPPYVYNLDLKNCGLSSLNFCDLMEQMDLHELDVRNNNLPCNCQMQWLDKHLEENRQQMGGYGSNILLNSPVKLECATRNQRLHISNLKLECHDEDRRSVLTRCKARPMHLDRKQVKLCEEKSNFASIMKGETLSSNWSIGDLCSNIYGFNYVVRDSINTVMYESVTLHPETRSFTIHDDELCCGEMITCLKFMYNQTHALFEKCEVIHLTHSHMFVGIIAGSLFLFPCLLVLGYVMYVDYVKRKSGEIFTNQRYYKDMDSLS